MTSFSKVMVILLWAYDGTDFHQFGPHVFPGPPREILVLMSLDPACLTLLGAGCTRL